MLNPDTVIGDRYIVKRKLAEGGMAEIYLCTAMGPEGFEKEVVIKRIRSFWGDDDMFVQMFIAEARLASRLNHANIVQIFHFDKHEDTYYLAMEYVNGPSLRDFLRKTKEKDQPLPILLASEIAANIARGLHYAHNLSIVHRDVSPHNILLSFDGNIKLADFGIAKTSTQHTSPGVLKGKFAYMAPEQARGEAVDARTDVFALGIVLWETLTRSRLFEYDSYINALQALQENLIVQPSRFNAEVPEALDRIVLTALNRNPSERYQTAQALERALFNFILQHARSADDTNLSHFLRTVYDDTSTTSPEKKEASTRTYTPPSSPSQKSPPIFARSAEPAKQLASAFTPPKNKTPAPQLLEPSLPVTKEEVAHAPEKAAAIKQHKSLANSLRHPAAIALALVVSAGIGVYGTLHFQSPNTSPAEPLVSPPVASNISSEPDTPLVPPDILKDDLGTKQNISPQVVSSTLAKTEAPHAPPALSTKSTPPPSLPTKIEEKPPPQNVEPGTLSMLDLSADKSGEGDVVPSAPLVEAAPQKLPPAAATARLTIDARPWAWVSINNAKRVEVFGKREFRLPPGTHRIRFLHPSKEEVQTIQIKQAADHQTVTFNAAP